MSRIEGLEKADSLFSRVVFFFTRRRLGKVIMPVRVQARHRKLFKGYVQMELAQQKARRVPIALKALADVRVATLVGCPF